jgi:purine-nucleoside phosphorylase
VLLNEHRPNTGVPDSLILPKLVLCCGEDAGELLKALSSVFPASHLEHHKFRCYEFWRFERFTVCWSGIGTGCLEPLLYEILDTNRIKEIIMVGTAGAISKESIRLGSVYLAEEAFLAGSAVNLPLGTKLAPRFPRQRHGIAEIGRASVASSDYYYGFSNDGGQRSKALRKSDQALNAAVLELWNRVNLVDMETAQFYHFCSILGEETLSYASLRGASNYMDSRHQQIANTSLVLKAALRAALNLLDILT